MPTPFTHLAVAQRLMIDSLLTRAVRDLINAQQSAFLLGNIAADARTENGMRRAETHFYAYDTPIRERPWRVMLREYPDLWNVRSLAQQAFLVGYVAHLSMDEVWTLRMLGPHFIDRAWAAQRRRFFMLHILLIHMDERDYAALQPRHCRALCDARPRAWLPFMSDAMLIHWRDFIGQQIAPDGASGTLEVLGARLGQPPEAFRAILDDPQQMQNALWQHIPPALLATVETEMYEHAREQIGRYIAEARA